MRRALFTGFLPVITALAALVPAGAAQADRNLPVTDPLHSGQPNGSITLPSNRCGFPVDIAVVSNNEHQDVMTLADGTTITQIRGKLVLSFTNDTTGYTIVRNVSGPTTETDHADASGTFVGRGQNWFGFGPISQSNTQEPGLVFTNGLVKLQFGHTGITSFSLDGEQLNGCALLAP
jgi:hypothetical protein